MEITDDMLEAAVRKAIEAGLLPRNACRDDAQHSKELMRLIVQAALSLKPRTAFRYTGRRRGRHWTASSFSGAMPVKLAIPRYPATETSPMDARRYPDRI